MNFDTNTIVIIAAVLAVLIIGFLVMRPRKATPRIDRTESPEYVADQTRPYMKTARPDREGNGVTDEVAAATTDVAGEVFGLEAHRELGAGGRQGDDFQQLKGVGPKFETLLNTLGVNRFAQLAEFSETELAHLDERLGAFRGRLARDRIAEQAAYLARGDIDGFEDRFGKLGS